MFEGKNRLSVNNFTFSTYLDNSIQEMASANYAGSKQELNLSDHEVDQGNKTNLERDKLPPGTNWDDWSVQNGDGSTSGAGVESLRESELSLEEAEGFKGATEGGVVEEVADTNDGAEIPQDDANQTSGAGGEVLEGACQKPGNAQSTKKVMIKFIAK